MNKKNKITFLSLFVYPLFNKDSKVIFGGSEVQLFNLSNELIKKGIEVSFVVGDYTNDYGVEEFNGMHIYKVFNLKKNNFLNKLIDSFRLFFYLYKINSDIYVVRAAGPEVGIAGFYCKLFRKNFVYMTAHEIDCSGEYRKRDKFLGRIYEYGLKKAMLVIAQNKEQQLLLKKTYNIEAPILKSGYEIPAINLQDKRDFILWVARLDTWKQPEKFIELAKFFPKEKFVMIAPVADNKKYADKIKQEAIKYGINFISGVPFHKIDDYFKNAKLFVNTSKYEGFPNTFIQAAMHAKPILSLLVNPDGIFKNNVGFCANNSFKELVEKLNVLLTDTNIYAKFSEGAYAYVKNNNDIKETADEFANLLINK